MSRLSTGLAVGIPAGAVLLYETVFRGLSLGYDTCAVSRTVPKQRRLLREEYALPEPRSQQSR